LKHDANICICICTHSRYDLLGRLLEALEKVDTGGELEGVNVEILFVDNSSCPKTKEKIQSIAPRFPISLRYVAEPERGISQARNRAVQEALASGADFIAFIDDDDLPTSNWLLELFSEQRRTDAHIVFGCWIMSSDMPGWVKKSGIFKTKKRGGGGKEKQGSSKLPYMASTCNVLIGREVFERSNFREFVFDPRLSYSGGEDKDFFIRALQNGANITTAPNSIVIRNHDSKRYSVAGLLRRGFKNGCSHMKKARLQKGALYSILFMFYSCVRWLVLLAAIPFCIFSKGLMMHQIYKLGKASGAIYFFFTGVSYAYYRDGA